MQKPITEIAGYPYPDKLSYFRANCRNYANNQYWLKSIERSLKEQDSRNEQIFDYSCNGFASRKEFMERYHALQANVKSVEETLKAVEMFYGSEAAAMLKEAYVERKHRKDVAEKYHISENVLQRKARTMLESIMYEREELQ
jgi:hypothetical protein